MSLVAAAAICVTFWSQSLSLASGSPASGVAVQVASPVAVPEVAKAASDIPSDSVLVLDEDSEEFKLTATVDFEDKDSLGEFSHDLLDGVENEMQQSKASEL